ncbi:protein kinase [Inquilinus sp. CAU 1745]|uniref:protein kinase domain-containing protein n=1 Tax=Inquilinus sp. CAU 1745 TaxID=3140369 RepID=UPI00325AFDA9
MTGDQDRNGGNDEATRLASAPGFSNRPPIPSPKQDEGGRQSTIPAGRVLNHTYRVEELLARGGMGEVYRATHADMGTQHAIKVILPELASDPKILDMFRREAGSLRSVRNDAVVAYDGVFRDEDGRLYLVMEYVVGPSLAETIRDGALPPGDIIRLRDRLAGGLGAAHVKGIVHRDISPDNIILPEGKLENAKIIDFGIAKLTDPTAATIIGDDFAGKYSYVSPEQLGMYGGKVGAASDIYSLGLVLVAAAIGEPLDMGQSPITVVEARRAVPDLSRVPPTLIPGLTAMLQPDPADRPSSMYDLIDWQEDQRPAATGAPSAASRPAGRAEKKGSSAAMIGVAAVALLAAAGGAGWYFLRHAGPETIATATPETTEPVAGPVEPVVEPPEEPVTDAPVDTPPTTATPAAPEPESEPASAEPSSDIAALLEETSTLLPDDEPAARPDVAPEPEPEPEPTAPVAATPEPETAAPPEPEPVPVVEAQPEPEPGPAPEPEPVISEAATPEPRIAEPPIAEPQPEEPQVAALPTPVDPGAIQQAAERVFAGFDCAGLDAVVSAAGRISVSGYVGSADAKARLSSAIAGIPGATGASVTPAVRPWPHCAVLNVLDAHTRIDRDGTFGLSITPNSQSLTYRDGERMFIDVSNASLFDGYLSVSFIDKEGNVVHLFPMPLLPDNAVSSGERVALGAEREYLIGPPFGDDMLIAISSPTPLFVTPRAEVESAADYLPALAQALESSDAANHGQEPVSQYVFITSVPAD